MKLLSSQDSKMNTETGDVDYKEDHKFADVMSDKNVAVSDFAKKKTIKEQREFLPIYAVRQEVRVIVNIPAINIVFSAAFV